MRLDFRAIHLENQTARLAKTPLEVLGSKKKVCRQSRVNGEVEVEVPQLLSVRRKVRPRRTNMTFVPMRKGEHKVKKLLAVRPARFLGRRS